MKIFDFENGKVKASQNFTIDMKNLFDWISILFIVTPLIPQLWTPYLLWILVMPLSSGALATVEELVLDTTAFGEVRWWLMLDEAATEAGDEGVPPLEDVTEAVADLMGL